MTFLAVVVGTVLCFPIDSMARRLPRWLAVLITLVVFLGVIAAAVVFLVPIVREQLDQLPGQIAAARERASTFLRSHGGGTGAGKSLATHASGAASHALPLVKHAFEAASGAVVVIVLAFFFASARDELRLGVRRLVPRRHEPLFDEWWARTAATLRRWVGGVFVSMVIMGVLTGVGLAIAGIDACVLLGIVTFFGTFVPYVGAIASALPGLAVALAQSPRHLVYALIVYVVVHHVEGSWSAARHAARGEAAAGAAAVLAGDHRRGVRHRRRLVATPLLACVQESVRSVGRATAGEGVTGRACCARAARYGEDVGGRTRHERPPFASAVSFSATCSAMRRSARRPDDVTTTKASSSLRPFGAARRGRRRACPTRRLPDGERLPFTVDLVRRDAGDDLPVSDTG